MPLYTITDPVTKKTLKVRGDSAPTEEELHQLFAGAPSLEDEGGKIRDKSSPQFKAEEQRVQEQERISHLDKNRNPARLLEAAQGLGFGFADEVVGAERALGNLVTGNSPAEGYREGTEQARNALREYEQERPWEALGFSAAGSIPAIGASAPVKGAQGAALASKLPLGKRMFDAAKVGAGYGGLSGVGSADGDFSDRARGGVIGSIFGGGLGWALPAVPAAIKGTKNFVTRMGQSADDFGATAIAKALETDGVTPQQLQALTHNPEKALIDIGGRATTAVGEQGALQGEGRRLAETFYDQADKGSEGNLISRIKSVFSDTPLYDKMDEVMTKRAADAGPLYREAYTRPYRRTPKLRDLSTRPAVAQAARIAMTRLKNDPDLNPAEIDAALGPILGKNVEDLSDAQITQRFTQALGTRPIEFKVLDYIKRGLDKVVEDNRGSPELRRLRNHWRDELKELNPAYQKALNSYAGPSATLDALEQGRSFIKMDPEAITRELATMGEAEQEAFRIGVSRKLQDLASEKGGAQKIASHIAENNNLKKRLAAVVGSSGADAETMLGRNGWKPVRAGVYKNTTQPNSVIQVKPDGTWTIEQTSKTGKSSTIKGQGADQSSLETLLTGQAPQKPTSSVDDLISLAESMVKREGQKKEIIKGSQTARRQEGSAAFDELGETVKQAGQAMRNGPFFMVGHVISATSDKLLKGLTGKRREAISRMLFSQDPQEKMRALDLIQQIRQGKNIDRQLYSPGYVPAISGEVVGQSQ